MEGGCWWIITWQHRCCSLKFPKDFCQFILGWVSLAALGSIVSARGWRGQGLIHLAGKLASMRLQQARGGHRDSRKVSRWAGPLSNIFWAALVGKKITLTIILSSPKVDILHSSDISAPCITVYIIWIIQCMVIIWVCLVHVASFLGRTEEK